MYIQLPFMEDLRQFSFPSLENNKKVSPTGTVFLKHTFKALSHSSKNCLVDTALQLTSLCKIVCIYVTSLDTQLSAVDSLIDSMMLVKEGDDEKPEDMFKVHHIPNPEFQRLFQVLKPSINSKIQLSQSCLVFCCVTLSLVPLRHKKVLWCLMNAGQLWALHF